MSFANESLYISAWQLILQHMELCNNQSHRIVVREVKGLLGRRKSARILDVCTGTGNIGKAVSTRNIPVRSECDQNRVKNILKSSLLNIVVGTLLVAVRCWIQESRGLGWECSYVSGGQEEMCLQGTTSTLPWKTTSVC